MCYENTRSTKNGKRLILQLGLNALIDKTCQGCRFHNYPYKFQSVIRDEFENLPTLNINNDVELWNYIYKLKLESENSSQAKGRSLSNVIIDIYEQLPFFCCPNKVLDEGLSKDIERYTYCTETGVLPYDGSFGATPELWKKKYFILRNLFNKYKEVLQKRRESKQSKK